MWWAVLCRVSGRGARRILKGKAGSAGVERVDDRIG